MFRGIIMAKRPDYQLEYVYRKSDFKKAMWICFAIWLVLRAARVVLYLTFGITFLSSIPAAFIFFFTGMVAGVALMWVVLYRKSVRVDEIEREKRRLSK